MLAVDVDLQCNNVIFAQKNSHSISYHIFIKYLYHAVVWIRPHPLYPCVQHPAPWNRPFCFLKRATTKYKQLFTWILNPFLLFDKKQIFVLRFEWTIIFYSFHCARSGPIRFTPRTFIYYRNVKCDTKLLFLLLFCLFFIFVLLVIGTSHSYCW